MQAEESSHATENRKRLKRERKLNLRERRNWSVQFKELADRIYSLGSSIGRAEMQNL